MTGKTQAIEIERLNKWYGDYQALKDIDWTVEHGERVVVCGPSGSGKSTLIRCINSLEDKDSGTISVDGIEMEGAQSIDAIRSEVGMVFQQFNLFPHMTALQNCIEAPIEVLGMKKEEAEERALDLLKLVGLTDKKDEHPSRLSGGQQQRVAIARALAMRPKVML